MFRRAALDWNCLIYGVLAFITRTPIFTSSSTIPHHPAPVGAATTAVEAVGLLDYGEPPLSRSLLCMRCHGRHFIMEYYRYRKEYLYDCRVRTSDSITGDHYLIYLRQRRVNVVTWFREIPSLLPN